MLKTLPEKQLIKTDSHDGPPFDVHFKLHRAAEVNFIERIQYYFRGHTDFQAVIDAWENYGNQRCNGVIPEPNGGESLPSDILELLKESPHRRIGLHIDLKDKGVSLSDIAIALEKLIDDGKIERTGDRYRLAKGGKK